PSERPETGVAASVLVTFDVQVGLGPASAAELLNGAREVVVARVRVDHRGDDAAVAGKALGQPDVLGAGVDARDRRVPQHVQAHVPLETRALLPDREGVPELPRRQPRASLAHEERGGAGEALALTRLPRSELVELGAPPFGEQHLLAVVVAP